MMKNILVILGAIVFVSACSQQQESELDASNRPKSYRTLCKLNDRCTVDQETNVAFGASGAFVYKRLSGTFLCVKDSFGSDPIPQKKAKECSIPIDSESSPKPGSKPSVPEHGQAEPIPAPSSDADSQDECRAGAVIKNKTIDCGGKTIGLSCDSDSESQPPVLTLVNASIKNVRLAANGGSDGIHCIAGDCVLENVVWEDICEDAATHKSDGGTMTIVGGSVYNDANGPGGKPDKIFQHNSRNSTTIITGGFTVKGQNGKLWRSCGDCSENGGPRQVIIDDVVVEGTLTSGVVGPNRNFKDKAKIRNLRIRNYQPGKPTICDEYIGVVKGNGKSTRLGEFFQTETCDVSHEDITSF